MIRTRIIRVQGVQADPLPSVLLVALPELSRDLEDPWCRRHLFLGSSSRWKWRPPSGSGPTRPEPGSSEQL